MFRLYELIWRRFLACQMAPAVYDQTSIDIAAGRATLPRHRHHPQVLGLPRGLRRQADEATRRPAEKRKDEEEAGAESTKELPPLEAGEVLTLNKLAARAALHPAAAALHRGLAGEGVGREGHRPASTYASILSVIQDKEYVEKVEGRFHPTELGTLVNELLVKAFPT